MFRNSILAGDTLIRDAIQSENYVPGTAGWQITRDGSAEFDDVAMRGTLTADDGTQTSYLRAGILGVELDSGTEDTFMQSGLIENFDTGANYGSQIFLNSAYIHLRWYLSRRSFVFKADDFLYSVPAGSNPGLASRETWNGFAFQNAWANFGAPYDTCAYKLDALGWVNFKGVAAPGVLAAGTVIANIPVGYRPLAAQQMHYYGTVTSILEFQTNGNVVIITPGGHPAGGALSITGFRYPVV